MVPRPARAHVVSDVLLNLSVTPSANALTAAREIWLVAVDTLAAPKVGPAMADLVGEQLRTGLSRWVGMNGSQALLTRAVRLVAERHPAIGHLPSLESGSPSPTAVGRPASARAVAAGMTALIAMVIELLGHLIGAEIALSLVRQSVGPSLRGFASPQISRGRHG